jgi:hypothetical protein
MQAAVLLGIASEVELQNLFEQRYQELTDHCIKTHFGDNWTDFFQFPCLPLFAKPAPVKPTTKT